MFRNVERGKSFSAGGVYDLKEKMETWTVCASLLNEELGTEYQLQLHRYDNTNKNIPLAFIQDSLPQMYVTTDICIKCAFKYMLKQ